MPFYTKQTLTWAVYLATVLTLCSAEVIQEANPNNMNDEKQWSNIQMPEVSYFEGNLSLISEIYAPSESYLNHQLLPQTLFIGSIKYDKRILTSHYVSPPI
jgi:hypothetical protein